MINKYLISVVGPTAIGKTAMAIEIAKHFNTEILSADSRQFYKEMSIGTAKPTQEEREQAIHHFIDCRSITEDYSAGDFERDALVKLEEVFEHKDIAVLVGGSGLFVKALCEGLDSLPQPGEGVRDYWNQEYQKHGVERLQTYLKQIDPAFYETAELSNPQRLIRAIEVYETTGKPFSYYRKREVVDRPFKIVPIGLNMEREHLYNRINRRVDQMMEQGLLQEVRFLLPYKDSGALQTVGYSELFEYLDGSCSLDEAVENIKRNTRRYAKRQITWFKRMENIRWFHPSEEDEILNYIRLNIGNLSSTIL